MWLGGRYVVADHIFVYDTVQLSVLQVVCVAGTAVLQPGTKQAIINIRHEVKYASTAPLMIV